MSETPQRWLLPFDDVAKELLSGAVAAGTCNDAATLWRIGHYDMPLTAAQALAKSFRAHADDLPGAFRSLRVGLIGSDTLSFLADALSGAGLKHGLAITGCSATLATALPTIARGENPLGSANLDFVVVLPGINQVSPQLGPGTDVEQVIISLLDDIKRVVDWIVDELGSTPVLGLCAPGLADLQNSADVFLPWSETSVRRNLNSELAALAAANGWPLWNVDQLSAEIGLEHWRSDKQYFLAKLPFNLQQVMRVADSVARILAAACGKTRRALVLDLDNTLWGGVIGEDGVGGLLIGEGSTVAEAYRAVQQLVLNLKKRGVLLAVCSKNDEAVARRPFSELPDMLLKEADFAVFQANWEDKATNILAISRALNLTTSSLAFLDDNPAERARVRQMLPEVAVIELGDDPADFARRTLASGYFEHLTLTDEDLSRADEYAGNSRRAEILGKAGDYDDYLQSLQMVLAAHRFDEGGRQRITQLIQKSNQFNLTTRRYSVQEVAELETSSSHLGLQFRLADRFGENGMISVVIVDISKQDVWEIDAWLMSCRVLKRGVEQAVLDVLIDLGKKAGVHRLVGCYIESSKNTMVADHYPSLGFVRTDGPFPDGRWSLDVSKHVPNLPPIRVKVCV
jgi:FkbH-like protein